MANSDYIQSVLKAAEMLKVVGDFEDGIKLSQIAESMNQKLPAAHHLSRTLISCGFLRKKQDNSLVLGDELIRLAGKGRDNQLIDAASGELNRLYNLFPQSVVVLAEANLPRIELVMRISYERPNVIQREQGQIFNIYVNAVALASLAMFDDESRELMMHKQPFSEYGAHLWKSFDKLLAFLAKVRKEGVAISPFDQETSFRIAAPLVNHEGILKGAMGVSIPASKIKGKTMRESLKANLLESASRINKKI
jgi:IclR family acetate operon transcriptional repressor